MFRQFSVFLFATLLLPGCTDKKVAATKEVESAVQGLIPAKGGSSLSPDAAMIAAYAEQAAAAIKTNDYFGATVILQDLRSKPNLNPDQWMAVQNAMDKVQGNLVNRAEAGDPAAQEALQALRMRRRR